MKFSRNFNFSLRAAAGANFDVRGIFLNRRCVKITLRKFVRLVTFYFHTKSFLKIKGHQKSQY